MDGSEPLQRVQRIPGRSWITRMFFEYSLTFSAFMEVFQLQSSKVFNRPGVARAVLQTPLSLINSLIKSWFVKISLRRRHAQMVENGAFSHKIDYITIF